jgi:hypothetical protein
MAGAPRSHLLAIVHGYLLSRNVQIEADLVDQLFNSSEKWLARVLLLLAHFGKDGKLDLVIPTSIRYIGACGHDAVADQLLHEQIRKLGFIEYNGSLKVHSSLLNVIVHD